jgi:hypothetical protein
LTKLFQPFIFFPDLRKRFVELNNFSAELGGFLRRNFGAALTGFVLLGMRVTLKKQKYKTQFSFLIKDKIMLFMTI